MLVQIFSLWLNNLGLSILTLNQPSYPLRSMTTLHSFSVLPLDHALTPWKIRLVKNWSWQFSRKDTSLHSSSIVLVLVGDSLIRVNTTTLGRTLMSPWPFMLTTQALQCNHDPHDHNLHDGWWQQQQQPHHPPPTTTCWEWPNHLTTTTVLMQMNSLPPTMSITLFTRLSLYLAFEDLDLPFNVCTLREVFCEKIWNVMKDSASWAALSNCEVFSASLLSILLVSAHPPILLLVEITRQWLTYVIEAIHQSL